MIELLIALLVALSNGATAVRVPSPADVAPEVYEQGPAAIVEYTTPRCANMDDEPCYVVVSHTSFGQVQIEVGP